MTDYKAKMHQIRFRLGLCPRPRWGSLQRSPDTLAGFVGRFTSGELGGLGKRRGRGGKGKWRGGKGRAPKLLLNQGPSEPCYATGQQNTTPLVQLNYTLAKSFLAMCWRATNGINEVSGGSRSINQNIYHTGYMQHRPARSVSFGYLHDNTTQ